MPKLWRMVAGYEHEHQGLPGKKRRLLPKGVIMGGM